MAITKQSLVHYPYQYGLDIFLKLILIVIYSALLMIRPHVGFFQFPVAVLIIACVIQKNSHGMC